jgi:hypothetical protein
MKNNLEKSVDSATSKLAMSIPDLTAEFTNSSNMSIPNHDRANATFVFLCRNNDIHGVVSSIQQLEDRFNRRHGYPWVLLNEEPFTEDFKRCVVQLILDFPYVTNLYHLW